jgi:hypothetical protein
MTTKQKPAAYNNSWLGNTVTEAQLQVINEQTNKWDTVGTCTDTPNAIAKELSKKKYKGLSIWVKSWDGRKYHGLVK